MAITEIHAIETTPDKALNYTLADKVVEIKSEDEINKEIPHEIIEDKEHGKRYVHYFTITGFQDCALKNPYHAFKERQAEWQGVRYKNGGSKSKSGREPLMYHLHQSFSGFEVPYEVANEIGMKLASEVFKGFIVTVSTHGNTANIHNHIIISAWDSDGKKWNDCHAAKRLIRSVSDRLCMEYGLSVLEHTKDMRLIKYKSKDGKVHFYEPTDRKNALIKKRNAGEVTTDDVNSYRNMPQFREKQEKRMDNKQEIKSDIDTVLPTCRSYDELLERLRELGYTIRDKKKNGEWLSHISFLAPTQERGTREDKIGDGKFYLRANLEKVISEQVSRYKEEQPSPTVNHGDNAKESVPYFPEYEYGKTTLSDIDNDFKTVYENGEYQTMERTGIEKKVISDIRVKDSEVRGLIDTTQLHKIVLEQGTQRKLKKPYLTKSKEHRLVAQIQNSFRCLQYTEQHHIFSYNQIIDLYSACKTKYEATKEQLVKADTAIAQFKEILLIPQKLEDLLEKIESNKNDISYVVEEYNEDKKTAGKYKALLARYKIDKPQGQQALRKKVMEFEAKQNIIRGHLESAVLQMSDLENCIQTFDRIDTERGSKNMAAMQSFEALKKSQEINNSEKEKMKGRDGR